MTGAISKPASTPFFLLPDIPGNYFYEASCDSLSHLGRVQRARAPLASAGLS